MERQSFFTEPFPARLIGPVGASPGRRIEPTLEGNNAQIRNGN